MVNYSSKTIKNVTAVLLVCLYGVEAVLHELPAHFPQCKRTDPKLHDCLLKATETMRPYLKKGIPEFNIPSVDPFTLPEVTLEQGTQALNFKATLTDTIIHGLGNYKFSQFYFDVPNLQFQCTAMIQELHLEGAYNVNGRVLIAPIAGNGKFTASISQCNVTVYQKLEVVQKKGEGYILPSFTNSSITVSDPKAKLNGLFNGNEEINRAANNIINENVDVLFEDLKPVVEKVISEIIENTIIKSLLYNVPYDKLYPK